MKVDTSRIQPPVPEQAKHNTPPKVHQPEPKNPTKQVEKSTAGAETAPQQNRAQGAMRLLQEGHFKGVAALRLRINFFDQLSTLEQETIQMTAQESVAELTLAMQEQIDDLNNSGLVGEDTLPQLTELADTFASEIQNSVAGEKLDPQQLTTTLEQHYGNFRTALQNLLLPPEPTTPQEAEAVQAAATEGISPAIEQDDENSPTAIATLETEQASGQAIASPVHTVEEREGQVQLAARLDALDSTFRSQLSHMEERLQAASLPSVPEQPDNNGAAFQTFLSIYKEMQGMAEVGSEQTEAIDT